MRLINWLVALPVTLLAISFAASNLGEISLRLWPIEREFPLPIPVFSFIILLIGFLLGAITTWFGAGSTRSRARQAERKSRQQAQEISSLEQKLGIHTDSTAVENQTPDKPGLPSN